MLTACGALLAQDDTGRPKIGVALSGGGAKGAAHVGVLKVLEEMNVPIDYIAGTSMGAIVGGLYASGMTADELMHELATVDWSTALDDVAHRRDVTFRRKEDQLRLLVDLELGIKKKGISFPPGLRSGQNLYLMLETLTLPVAEIQDFDNLAIPFRCVATDIQNGEPVVLDSGHLAVALRASMAIPTVFSPVQVGDKLLVDGGIVENLPTRVVREMGADIVIAVDLGAALTERQVNDLLKIYRQMSRMLIRKNVERSLEDADIIITPGTGKFGTLDFSKIEAITELGYTAAKKAEPELRPLAVSPTEYARFRERHHRPKLPTPIVDDIRIEGNERVDDRVIGALIRMETGQPLDLNAMFTDIARIYGLEDFEQVYYELEKKGDHHVDLVIHIVEKPWGPTYLRFGIQFETNLDGDLLAEVLFDMNMRNLNKKNAEWRNDIQIGRRRILLSEFYQPLQFKPGFFVAPRLFAEANIVDLFDDGEVITELDASEVSAAVDFGYQFGRSAELRVGARYGLGNTSQRRGVPPPEALFDDAQIAGPEVRYRYDTLNNPYIPTRGSFVDLNGFYSRDALGSDQNYDRYEVITNKWFSFGRHTIFGSLDGGWSRDDNLPLFATFSIGGFFSFSGFSPNELRGQTYGVGRLGYYFRITRKYYFGGWVEAGNVWQTTSDFGEDLIKAGTLYLAGETIVGPLYIAYGHADGGKNSLYISLGRTF